MRDAHVAGIVAGNVGVVHARSPVNVAILKKRTCGEIPKLLSLAFTTAVWRIWLTFRKDLRRRLEAGAAQSARQ
jgi:hypothetical protein